MSLSHYVIKAITHFRNIEFAEFPLAATVSENQYALFRCRHERQDAIINWLLDGVRVPSPQYSDVVVGAITDSNGTSIDTLTIPAIPVYNRSEIVCVATFIDESPAERTPPVTLTITGQL